MRLRRGRIPLREQMERNLRALEFQSTTGTNPGIEAIRARLAALPPKRARVRRPVDGRPVVPLEKEVLADVMQALRRDPRVGFVWRQSSGTFQEGDRWIQAGPKGMPDICGFLAGTGRAFFIEVKRPGGKPDPRQATRLAHFARGGAIAGYATSAEEALALLPTGRAE